MNDLQGKEGERMEKEQMEKLQKLCVPIARLLEAECNPYTSVIITDNRIRVVTDEAGIPIKKRAINY